MSEAEMTVQQPENQHEIITLTKKEFYKPLWRITFFPMCTINYERFQTLQYFMAISPVLTKLYPNYEDKVEAGKRHMAFFNTTPGLWLAFIMGVSVATEEKAANTSDPAAKKDLLDSVNVVKASLMGPLAGIGDSLDATVRAIYGAVAASIAMAGSFFGAIFELICSNLYYVLLSYFTYQYGYKKGMSFLSDVNRSGTLDKLMDCACILGMMAVGALVPSWVGFKLNHDFLIGGFTLNIQTALDGILPGIPPLVLTLVLAKGYSKNVSSLKLVGIIFVAALVLSLVGF
ncbi:MAG: PTS system mannose/fructose/sorbose family transporter subunit IID [Erysipelotrichia bacterium]|nr:PTS system mannose/fructose/sorbose family transporter subunit IID [Erysipelotrichia bacterium]